MPNSPPKVDFDPCIGSTAKEKEAEEHSYSARVRLHGDWVRVIRGAFGGSDHRPISGSDGRPDAAGQFSRLPNMNQQTDKRRAAGIVRFMAWVLLAFSLICFCRLVFDARLACFGVRAEGSVTHVEARTTYGGTTSRRSGESWAEYQRRRDRRSGTSHFATVRFTPADSAPREFRTRCTFGHVPQVGDLVPVLHLASDPGVAEIGTARQVWLPLGVGIVVMIGSGGLGSFLRRVAARMKAAT